MDDGITEQARLWQVTAMADESESIPVLAQDRVWNSFALADLLPPFRQHTQIALAHHQASDQHAACLVLRHSIRQVLSPYGATAGVAAILARIDLPEHIWLQSLPNHLPILARHYHFTLPGRILMRMEVTPASYMPPDQVTTIWQLLPQDLADLQALYATHPDPVFSPDQLDHGLFFGVREQEHLVAAGGTHVVAPAMGIAVLGNIYTHPAARRRG